MVFEIHPGTLSGERLPLIVAALGDKTINFLSEDALVKREWQKVFIPQSELEGIDTVEKVRFWGRGQGTFYMRDIRWKYKSDRTLIASVNPDMTPSGGLK